MVDLKLVLLEGKVRNHLSCQLKIKLEDDGSPWVRSSRFTGSERLGWLCLKKGTRRFVNERHPRGEREILGAGSEELFGCRTLD